MPKKFRPAVGPCDEAMLGVESATGVGRSADRGPGGADDGAAARPASMRPAVPVLIVRHA